MCGLFGFVGDPKTAQSQDLDAIFKTLDHRGPDDRGVYKDIRAFPSCVLAHTRLSILDLSSAGHQPMVSPDGRYVVVYNGEIYNFKELRKELIAQGERFISDSDTEVLLRSFSLWGVEALRRFEGMFAFAIWDTQTKQLLLARDPMGIKPLYVHRDQRGLWFASELRTLLAAGCSERRISEAGLKSYLVYGSVSEPHTLLTDIETLPSGSYQIFDGTVVKQTNYFDLQWNQDTSKYNVDDKALRESLERAVDLRLISDAPLGIFLSGGMDSSLIVALAQQRGHSDLRTFTVTFDNPDYDEGSYARAMARRYGTQHAEVHLSEERGLQEIMAGLQAYDQPSADGLNAYVVSHAARQAGLKVALSGLGGDEVFAGYEGFRYFGRVRALAAPFANTHFLRRLLQRDIHHLDRFRRQKMLSLLAYGSDAASVYALQRAMFLPNQVAALLGESPPAFSGLLSYNVVPPTDDVNQYSAFELSNYLKNTLLRDTDAMSMAHGFEVRVPFLDFSLLSQVAGLPGKFKIGGQGNKPLLQAAVPELPLAAIRRPKMGFTLPLREWFCGPLQDTLKEIVFDSAAQTAVGIRGQAIDTIWRGFIAGEKYMSYSRVWCLVALLSWVRQHRVKL